MINVGRLGFFFGLLIIIHFVTILEVFYFKILLYINFFFSITTLSLKCSYHFYPPSFLLFPLACFLDNCSKCELWKCEETSAVRSCSRALGGSIKNFSILQGYEKGIYISQTQKGQNY